MSKNVSKPSVDDWEVGDRVRAVREILNGADADSIEMGMQYRIDAFDEDGNVILNIDKNRSIGWSREYFEWVGLAEDFEDEEAGVRPDQAMTKSTTYQPGQQFRHKATGDTGRLVSRIEYETLGEGRIIDDEEEAIDLEHGTAVVRLFGDNKPGHVIALNLLTKVEQEPEKTLREKLEEEIALWHLEADTPRLPMHALDRLRDRMLVLLGEDKS